MLPNVTQCHRTVPNGTARYQMVPLGNKWRVVAWNGCQIVLKYAGLGRSNIRLFCLGWLLLIQMNVVYDPDLFCPSHPPSEWLKAIVLRWLKINFIDWFSCWKFKCILIRQRRSFFGQRACLHTWLCGVVSEWVGRPKTFYVISVTSTMFFNIT